MKLEVPSKPKTRILRLKFSSISNIHFSLKIAMESPPTSFNHILAMPYPSRGHINPMLSFCKILTSQKPNKILITEEWLTIIGADPKPESIRFTTIPNVIPPEREKAANFPGLYEAVMTKMEAPFENVPVSAFWTMSATFYSMLHHLDVFSRNHHLTVDKLKLVKRFMNLESQEGKKIRDRAKEPKVVCCKAIGKGGFSDRNLDAFIIYDICEQLIDPIQQFLKHFLCCFIQLLSLDLALDTTID
ncbi:putative 7-deoxyloganetin glucosyltransferase [Medicago truncatula]|nr:putative 7-deoxyloganetin glucosyltransferase [Medicago truncatula]